MLHIVVPESRISEGDYPVPVVGHTAEYPLVFYSGRVDDDDRLSNDLRVVVEPLGEGNPRQGLNYDESPRGAPTYMMNIHGDGFTALYTEINLIHDAVRICGQLWAANLGTVSPNVIVTSGVVRRAQIITRTSYPGSDGEYRSYGTVELSKLTVRNPAWHRGLIVRQGHPPRRPTHGPWTRDAGVLVDLEPIS